MDRKDTLLEKNGKDSHKVSYWLYNVLMQNYYSMWGLLGKLSQGLYRSKVLNEKSNYTSLCFLK